MDIKAYTNDAVELLKELIAIPSVSRDETKAADCLSEYLNQWNLPHGREGNNLWIGCQDWDNNRPTLMLNAHIDTVKPVSSWTRDPFTPTQEGDILYGLGANDCGGGLVSLLQVYRMMLHRPRNYNILWVASKFEGDFWCQWFQPCVATSAKNRCSDCRRAHWYATSYCRERFDGY